jgi:hypothetical protein
MTQSNERKRIQTEIEAMLKRVMRTIGIDVIVGIFMVAGVWTISNGLLIFYDDFYYGPRIPLPSDMGNALFWCIEGLFFIYLAVETRKYRKIKLG